MNANKRPAPPPSFVLTWAGLALAATVADGDGAARSTNSAVTTRLGCPATVTMKSAGREAAHRPALLVDDADVDGDDLDAAAKRRRLLVGRGLLRRQRRPVDRQEQPPPTVTVTTPARMPPHVENAAHGLTSPLAEARVPDILAAP